MNDSITRPSVCDNDATQEIIDRALLSLWEVANELSRVRSVREPYRVTIFGSARVQPGDPLYENVRSLAERLSALGCDIVTGGGPGLMQAANQGAQAGDPDDQTLSVGVRVHLPFEKDANPFVEKVYTHKTFFTRLHHFVRLSSAYIVLPGGIGTTLETILVWQLLQVRRMDDVPLILVGTMWRDLVTWARRSMTEATPRYAAPEDMQLPTCVESVEEAAEIITTHVYRQLT